MSEEIIPYGKHYIDEDDVREVAGALTSGCLTGGKYVEEFEQALAARCGAKYAVAASSATAALHMAYLAAGLSGEGEAITTPVTFAATANAVFHAGGTPVFADVEADTGNICAEAVRSLVSNKTRLLVPVHYAGQPADLREIRRISRERNLMVVEDACHALGAFYGDSPVGSCEYSDMTVFSFHPVKHIATGEGGAVLTNDSILCHTLKLLRSHGILTDPARVWHKEMHMLGYNYRMTDIQAALGISQLRKLDRFLERRKMIAGRYDEAFREGEEICPVGLKAGRSHAYHLYPVQLAEWIDRERFLSEARRRKVGLQIHYLPVYAHPYYRAKGYAPLPAAEDFTRRVVSLPIYYTLSDEEQAYVIDVLKELVREG